MAWLSRVNFVSSDTLSFTDVNNLGNDIRAWGDNVNGGGYTLSNVVLSASSGTMATVTGGTGAASTLTIRSTSGTGTSDAIVFQTASQSERMRINASGNIGIGTPSIATKLDIRGTSATIGSTVQIVGIGVSSLMLGQDADGGVIRGQGGNSTLRFLVGGAGDNAAAAAGTEAMRIVSNGNVGIGTSTIGGKLTIVSGDSATASNQVIISGGRSVGNGAGAILFTNSFWNSGFGAANIVGLDSGSSGGHLSFGTLVDGGGASGTPTEKMRILSSGNVGIGTTAPVYQLQISTDSAAKPSTNTWTIASDARLKTVLGDYEKGLDAICALRPVRYEYNGLGGMAADGKEHISIVAQEAQEVFPECIGTFQGKLHGDDEEDTELLNYNGHAVTFALINAVRELKARLDALA